MAEFFPEVSQPIQFEGKDSRNPLSFRYYDAKAMINGKSMSDHLRFSVAYWHSFKGTGADTFGDGTFSRSWRNAGNPLTESEQTLDAAFEFFSKLGVEYYCFHDRDLAPGGASFAESCRNLEHMVKKAAAKQRETGIKLLWGTANLFGHPRYAHGAATNPDAHVFAYAAAQVRHAIAATRELGGENYVFWGGREGYESLINTDMKREQDNLARFFHLAVDYAKSIGFTGQFLIEPKPMEPTKHQYDFDAATVLSFLRSYDLLDHFELNIEANHA
ncbi:MAG: xylose isomerase, partial [bacterium]